MSLTWEWVLLILGLSVVAVKATQIFWYSRGFNRVQELKSEVANVRSFVDAMTEALRECDAAVKEQAPKVERHDERLKLVEAKLGNRFGTRR